MNLENLFDFHKEIVLEGYCKYDIQEDLETSFNNRIDKIYIYYLNTKNNKYQLLISPKNQIIEIEEVTKYINPEEFVYQYFPNYKFINKHYYVINECDYIERKILEKIESDKTIIFDLFDYILMIHKNKIIDNIELFEKCNKKVQSSTYDLFEKKILYLKRNAAEQGSLEEKILHLQDVSAEEVKAYGKKPKSEGGGGGAMKVR